MPAPVPPRPLLHRNAARDDSLPPITNTVSLLKSAACHCRGIHTQLIGALFPIKRPVPGLRRIPRRRPVPRKTLPGRPAIIAVVITIIIIIIIVVVIVAIIMIVVVAGVAAGIIETFSAFPRFVSAGVAPETFDRTRAIHPTRGRNPRLVRV